MINWNVHEENIAILGLQGSGKTTLAKNLLGSIPNTPRLIISPQNPQGLYGSYGIPVREIKDIQQNGAMLWVGKTDENTFENICNHVMAHLTNTVMVIDDCHEFCKKQKMPKAWATLINSGRKTEESHQSLSAQALTWYITTYCKAYIICFHLDLF